MDGSYGAHDIGAYPELLFVRGYESGRKFLWSELEGVNDYTSFQLEILGVCQVSSGVEFAAKPVGLVVCLSVSVGMTGRWPRWC